MNVIESVLTSVCTSSPTIGLRSSYSSSVRHITAFTVRFFMGWYIAWMTWYAIWPSSFGMTAAASSSRPISKFMHSSALLTERTYMAASMCVVKYLSFKYGERLLVVE